MNKTAMEQSIQADTPFKILSDIDRRSRQVAADLPKIDEVKAQWTGIGFGLGGKNLIAPLGQVQEILSNPEITNVPGAKSWIKGISNNRGILIPIIDLAAFLNMGATPVSRRNRVLVIQFGLLNSGLLVNEIRGQRHFLYEEEIELPAELSEPMKLYIEGAYTKGEDTWLLFNMRRLAETPGFIQAAA